VRILGHDDFVAGRTDTGFLDRFDPAELAASPLDVAGRDVHALGATVAVQAHRRATAVVLAQLPSGWRNNPSQPQQLTLHSGGDDLVVHYAFARDGALTAQVDGRALDVVVHHGTAEQVDMTVDGVRRRLRVALAGDTVDVDSALGSSSYRVLPPFADAEAHAAAGSLVAPMPGAVVRVLVEVGATVRAGQPLVVLEAMKMEHTVAAPAGGTVSEVKVEAGQQVEAGTVLVVVEEETSDAD
ncbi:MAG: propionyl-CoA carboxylase alpha chain, partial [Frankiaceae bacterium]|nr:propionyl-CoA carboxylase alpha chain [Frankiaceae bacterium]